jgi:hypothetical protein
VETALELVEVEPERRGGVEGHASRPTDRWAATAGAAG